MSLQILPELMALKKHLRRNLKVLSIRPSRYLVVQPCNESLKLTQILSAFQSTQFQILHPGQEVSVMSLNWETPINQKASYSQICSSVDVLILKTLLLSIPWRQVSLDLALHKQVLVIELLGCLESRVRVLRFIINWQKYLVYQMKL